MKTYIAYLQYKDSYGNVYRKESVIYTLNADDDPLNYALLMWGEDNLDITIELINS